MYCPLCGLEYRPGFSTCSDCQVALVPDPPRPSSAETSADRASFVAVWAGDDPLKHGEICAALDRQRIPARTLDREDRSFNLAAQPAFEVFVPADFTDSARKVIKEIDIAEEAAARSSESGNPETAEEEGWSGEDEDRGGTLDLNPEDATLEVWSGKDLRTAAMIVSSLRENQILCRSESGPGGSEDESHGHAGHDGSPQADASVGRDVSDVASDERGPIRLLVFPQDQRRAKEIVREIIDAVPPE